MKNYRKVWEKANGPIPIDELGRRYEIHHLDGNRNNNTLSNLVCISIQEHYQLHLGKGDYAAAYRIAQRMGMSSQVKSELASAANKRRLEESTHPFLDPVVRKKAAAKVAKRIKQGIQGLQDPVINHKAVQAKKQKYTSADLAEFAKKGWDKWKEKGLESTQRTSQGSIAGAKKTKGTKWYHKPTGEQLRTTSDDPRLTDEWIKGRFNGKELSTRANLSKLNKNN